MKQKKDAYHHPELHANPDQIPWDVDKEKHDLLPTMQTDITLKNSERTLIIDAKYYTHTLQQKWSDTYSIHSNNLYQIYAYVQNLKPQKSGEVAGMLLYARTDEQIQPDNQYTISGNMITVKTLDLNLPFPAIADQLERIANDYFYKDVEKIG